MGVVQ